MQLKTVAFTPQELVQAAKRIQNMKFRTHDELKMKNPTMKCPDCGDGVIDVD